MASRDRAVAAQNQRKSSRLHGLFDARLQRFKCGNGRAKISRARAFFVRLVKLGGIITEVCYFVADRAKPVDESRGA